ncbi:TolC family protein [Sphingopyxis sp.]|uniref:TolC family protein n=1 Tax=Sphingopyxis sp. TaxID=1908224 RepID=UPI0025F5AC8D|nr:TolC family protein [Sphingopyxis sp.]
MAVLTAALLLGGCATLPQKSALPARAAVESIASVNSFAAPDCLAVRSLVGVILATLSFPGLIAEGLVGATDLRVAEARFARAQALVGRPAAACCPRSMRMLKPVRPSRATTISSRANSRPGWPDYGVATLRLDWELDFWGKNRAALGAARSMRRLPERRRLQRDWPCLPESPPLMPDLGSLHAERDAAARAVEVRGRTLELMEGRKAEGLENAGAVERARSALATRRGELAALDEALVLARNRIAVLLGAGPDRGLTITRPAPIAREDFGLPANLPAELIGRRPDIIAARLRSEAAASRIKERAAFYPNINLAGLIGLQALGLDNVFKSGSEFGTVGPAISLPIFDGGSLRGRYRASKPTIARPSHNMTVRLTGAARNRRCRRQRTRAWPAARPSPRCRARCKCGLGGRQQPLSRRSCHFAGRTRGGRRAHFHPPHRRNAAGPRFRPRCRAARALGGGFRS